MIEGAILIGGEARRRAAVRGKDASELEVASDGRTTSVGALAMMRFLRPVGYQKAPDELPPLKAANPWRVVRCIDGQWV